MFGSPERSFQALLKYDYKCYVNTELGCVLGVTSFQGHPEVIPRSNFKITFGADPSIIPDI